MRRRGMVLGSAALLLVPGTVAAADVEDKRLQNRLELWANYARRTQNLLARYTVTRESSLLEEPLVATGTLIFAAPDTLVLQDDGLRGSTTFVDGQDVQIRVHGEQAMAGPPIQRSDEPAVAWLADRLLRAFAPGDPEALIEGVRTNVPKGKGYRLELMPPRGSSVRQWIRSVTLHFDPVAGGVTQILIAEAPGDRLHLRITDHRQNVPDEDIDAALQRAREQ